MTRTKPEPTKARSRVEPPAEPLDETPGKEATEESEKKERVLHTRVPAVLERELKRFASNLRIPVSNLVRAILEDAIEAADLAGETVEGRLKNAAQQLGLERERLKKRVLPDPLADVFAFQQITLAQGSACAKCGRALHAGEDAHLGLFDGGVGKAAQTRIVVCTGCVPRG